MTKAKTVTVIIKKPVDGFHRVGRPIDVPHDKYHKGLIKGGWLELVPEHTPDTPPEDAGATEPDVQEQRDPEPSLEISEPESAGEDLG